MKKEELDRLLEKYYKGESSEEEELSLKTWFSSPDIPEGYEAEKEVFLYLNRFADVPQPTEGFEDRIIAALDENDKKPVINRLLLITISAAASLIILAVTWWFINSRVPKDTFSDPVLAYNETLKILSQVSGKMSRGTQALEPFAKMNNAAEAGFAEFQRSAKDVRENLQGLGHIQKALDFSRSLENKEITK